jgi:sulfite dehydrogenase (quinone) subunit SoeC
LHPSASVILFTTASGAGYGLLIWLGLAATADLVPPDRLFGFIALGVATALISIGLLSSTFHLGRPERAWRAFSQWRSSWLSREGVAAVATFVPTAELALGWIWFGRLDSVYAVAGPAASLLALLTLFCTGQIYASLKPIRQWNNRWTTPVYLALALYTGAILLVLLTLPFGVFRAVFGALALLTLAAGAGAKFAYWRSIDAEPPRSTTVTATGLTQFERVRLFEAPHTEANFIMMEMGFQIARKHSRKLRRLVWATLFAVPAVSLILTLALADRHQALAMSAALVATLSAGLGVATERWLFFAEATHTSMIYYGQAV